MRSRAVMMELFKNQLRAAFPDKALAFDSSINVHHNYVAEEEIDGRMMLVTRKGAIRAGRGDLALIPGSMGTGSYVVRGLGNNSSFQSASHGAGRRMSRSAAKRAFTGEDEGAAEIARQLGTIESRRDSGIIDELPGSYKDIHSVIAAQSELVDVVQHLRTILCVKG
jgi:tRNA-splicing ligase RtcB